MDLYTQRKQSADIAVAKDTRLVFLLPTSDKPFDCRNSLVPAAACREKGLPVPLHLFGAASNPSR